METPLLYIYYLFFPYVSMNIFEYTHVPYPNFLYLCNIDKLGLVCLVKGLESCFENHKELWNMTFNSLLRVCFLFVCTALYLYCQPCSYFSWFIGCLILLMAKYTKIKLRKIEKMNSRGTVDLSCNLRCRYNTPSANKVEQTVELLVGTRK